MATLVALSAGMYFGIAALRKGAFREQVGQLTKEVKTLKDSFNHWRALPGGEGLRSLLAEQSRRENLSKAAELAKANKQLEAINYLEACLGPELAPYDRASIFLLMGNAYMAVGELNQALTHHRQALSQFQAIGAQREIAKAKENIAAVNRPYGSRKPAEHGGRVSCASWL